MVCLAAEIPEILHALGALDRVVGISAYTTRPAEALRIPKVSGFQHGSVERILSVRPQLAILTSDVQRDLAVRLGEAGVTVVHLHPHRLTDVFDTIRLLGRLVGARDQAEALCAKLQADLDTVAAAARQLPRCPRVYFEEWMEPLISATGWVSDVIELAGGQDIFREKALAGRKAADRVVTWDEVVAEKPDVILASWCGKPFEPEDVTSRPQADEIPAVRHGHVYEVGGIILQCGLGLVDAAWEVHRRIRAAVTGRA